MSYLEELLPEFRNGAKIRRKSWDNKRYIHLKNNECCDENGVLINPTNIPTELIIGKVKVEVQDD